MQTVGLKSVPTLGASDVFAALSSEKIVLMFTGNIASLIPELHHQVRLL